MEGVKKRKKKKKKKNKKEGEKGICGGMYTSLVLPSNEC